MVFVNYLRHVFVHSDQWEARKTKSENPDEDDHAIDLQSDIRP